MDAWEYASYENLPKRTKDYAPQIEQMAIEFATPFINQYTPGRGGIPDRRSIMIDLVIDYLEKQRTRPKEYKAGCHRLPY